MQGKNFFINNNVIEQKDSTLNKQIPKQKIGDQVNSSRSLQKIVSQKQNYLNTNVKSKKNLILNAIEYYKQTALNDINKPVIILLIMPR